MNGRQHVRVKLARYDVFLCSKLLTPYLYVAARLNPFVCCKGPNLHILPYFGKLL